VNAIPPKAKGIWCCWFPEVDFEADGLRVLVPYAWEDEGPAEFRLFPLRLDMDLGGRVARPLPALRGWAMENQKRAQGDRVVGLNDPDPEQAPLLVIPTGGALVSVRP